MAELTLTEGQRQGLLAAGIIRSWGAQWGSSSYMLAPGMTWADVYAVTGQPCRDCGELFPYDPNADRCPQCIADGEEYVDALERDEPKGPPCQ